MIDVDERIDKARAGLARLSEGLRQAFSLLHVEQVEEQRQRDEDKRQREERSARRLETLAAVFLVPTLVVGFYGANTWIPGQNKHWGFWVMVAALVVLSLITIMALHTPRPLRRVFGGGPERAARRRLPVPEE